MKISFVATVYNEEKTIGTFIESLFKQTKMPDEIIIVDGGSSDRTIAELKTQNSKLKTTTQKLKIFILPRSTIAQARNFGIKQATGDIIAMSDAGCIMHKDWLKKLTKPFVKDNADILAGFYRMTGSSPIQKALAVYLGIPPKRFDPNKFLPSARSMAFKKSLWKKIGGYNERLERTSEDTLFNYEALKLGAKFVRVKDALVDWDIPNSLWGGLKKFYIYAKGDAQAGIWWHPLQRISTHNLKIASVFVRYIVGFVLFLLAISHVFFMFIFILFVILYIFWAIWKIRDVVTDFRVRMLLPIVQIGSDIAVMLGTSWGILRRP